MGLCHPRRQWDNIAKIENIIADKRPLHKAPEPDLLRILGIAHLGERFSAPRTDTLVGRNVDELFLLGEVGIAAGAAVQAVGTNRLPKTRPEHREFLVPKRCRQIRNDVPAPPGHGEKRKPRKVDSESLAGHLPAGNRSLTVWRTSASQPLRCSGVLSTIDSKLRR